ncbi:hypothetical protein [Shewanella algae]|uniref:hypothetical protein n=1 Tax=Shewanella algae TaxID=38313 RepID=UPI0031F5218D
MMYLIIFILSLPLIKYVITVNNFRKFPVTYGYFFGVYAFIIAGAFYSLDGDNPFYGGNLDSTEFRIILLALIFTFYIIKIFIEFGVKGGRDNQYQETINVLVFHKKKSLLFTYRLFLLLHVIYVSIYFYNANYIQFVVEVFASTNASGIIEARTNVVTGGTSNHIFVFYNLSIFLGLACLSLKDYLKFNKIQLIYFGLCCLVFFHKMPIIFYIFSLWLFSVKNKRKLNIKNMVLIVIISIGIIFTFYIFYFSGRDINFYLIDMPYSILHRVVGVYSEAVALAIKMAESNDLYLGETFINPLNILDFTPVYLPEVLHIEFAGYPGAMVVPAVGEIFSNFGMLGALNYVFMISLFVLLVDMTFLKMNLYSNLATVFQVYFVYLAMKLSQASMFTSFFEPKNIVFILFFLFVYKLNEFILKRGLSDKNINAHKNSLIKE